MPLSCDELGIPPRLHRNGRGPAHEFESGERLFIRFDPDKHLLENGGISFATALSTEDQSCNRSAFCDSQEDVLYNTNSPVHFFHWGILEILAADASAVLAVHPVDPDIIHSFDVVHKPEECMYPHSQLELLKNGEPGGKPGSSLVRLNIKNALGSQMNILSHGQPSEQPEHDED